MYRLQLFQCTDGRGWFVGVAGILWACSAMTVQGSKLNREEFASVYDQLTKQGLLQRKVRKEAL